MSNPRIRSAERWASIEEFTGYEVSDHGRVRSLDRTVPAGRGRLRLSAGKVLRDRADKDGYRIVSLYRDAQAFTLRVHRLVAASFIRCPALEETINHKDFCRSNNYFKNLEWLSHADNVQYTTLAGRQHRPIKPVVAKLNGKAVHSFAAIFYVSQLGFSRNLVHACLSGSAKSHRGFTWERGV